MIKRENVPTRIYYPKPIHRHKAFKEYWRDPKGLHSSEALSNKVFSLPMNPHLGFQE